MRISPSTINLWADCPLKAYYAKILRLPQRQHAKATFGTCVHAALDQYERSGGDVDMAVKAFVDFWDNPAQLDAEPDIWPKGITFGGLRQKGVEIVRSYHARQRWDDRQVLCTEHHFVVPFGDHELEGIVDLLEIRDNHRGKQLLRIVDHKTNTRAPFVSELHLNIQGTVYVYASLQREFWEGTDEFHGVPNGKWWFEMLADTPRRFIWNQLWNGREYDSGARDEGDFERLYRVVSEIERAITHEVYVPIVSADSCGVCSFLSECRLSIPTTEEVQEDENAWLAS